MVPTWAVPGLFYSASVSCTKNFRVRYRVSTVKINFVKINKAHSKNTILTIFFQSVVKICQFTLNYEGGALELRILWCGRN